MDFVALVSGGKDSIFNIMECVSHGHSLVCVANLCPKAQSEEDSFMYQTVGAEAVQQIADCLEVPLEQACLSGTSLEQAMDYTCHEGDEVEDLYALLKRVKDKYPSVSAVSSGAILSNYQRIRIEHVASRLGLTSLSYLWQRDQKELLSEMVNSRIDARLVKVCSMGLTKEHLMRGINELSPLFSKIHQQFGFNICGEGGEYETLVLDCPLFSNYSVLVSDSQTVLHDNHSEMQHVAYTTIQKARVQPKLEYERINETQWLIFRKESIQKGISERMARKYQFKPIHEIHEPVHSDLDSLATPGYTPSLYCHQTPYLHTALLDTSLLHLPGSLSPSEQLTALLDYLVTLFSDKGMNLSQHCVYVLLLLPDIALFASLNSIYKTYFGSQPPVRITFQHCLSKVSIMATGCLHSAELTKQNLHVQSISHWAPANIGPYSQANFLGSSRLYLAGQIGILPENLELVEGLREQYEQTLSNYAQVITHVTGKSMEECAPAVKSNVVYVNQSISESLVECFYRQSYSPETCVIVQMEKFPKDALVEVEMFLDMQQKDAPGQAFTLSFDLDQSLSSQLSSAFKDCLSTALRLNLFVPLWLISQSKVAALLSTLLTGLIVNVLPVHHVYSLEKVYDRQINIGCCFTI